MSTRNCALSSIPVSYLYNPSLMGGRNRRFELLRTTTEKEWISTLQCLLDLSAAAHSIQSDPNRLKHLRSSVVSYLASHPALSLRMAFAIGFAQCSSKHYLTLETQFIQELNNIDLSHKRPEFESYIVPNETDPLRVLPHLSMTRPGLIVSTGTERSFFDLALSDSTKCEGLVVRDVNPNVKAYVDFNVLLLRIATNRKDYIRLSTVESSEIPDRLQEIQRITEAANLAPDIKEYYLKHLEEFGKTYFYARQADDWREKADCFQGVRYHEDDELFDKLQRYARSGNIIATVGDISELQFLDNRNIAILDVSNIPEYFLLNFKIKSNPKIISTKVYDKTYFSSMYRKLAPGQCAELDGLIALFTEMNKRKIGACSYGLGQIIKVISSVSENPLKTIDPSWWYYSLGLLEVLTKHKNQYCIQIGNRWFDFSPEGNLNDVIERALDPFWNFATFPLNKEEKELIARSQHLISTKQITHLSKIQLAALEKLRNSSSSLENKND